MPELITSDRIDACFFFSSRRRHTRWTGDWSSDVCSSDLKREKTRNRERDGKGERTHSGGPFGHCFPSVLVGFRGFACFRAFAVPCREVVPHLRAFAVPSRSFALPSGGALATPPSPPRAGAGYLPARTSWPGAAPVAPDAGLAASEAQSVRHRRS